MTPSPQISQVRIADDAKPVRKRGGQPGNRNRLRHGRYSAAAQERRDAIRAAVRKAEFLIMRANMVWRARKALERKRKIAAPAARPAHFVAIACPQVWKFLTSIARRAGLVSPRTLGPP